MAQTMQDLMAQKRELQARMADVVNDNEKANEFDSLERELKLVDSKISVMKDEDYQREHAVPVQGPSFREIVKDACANGKKREVTFAQQTVSGSTTASNTQTSAAAEGKTVNDILPTLEKGLVYDKIGLKMQTGVTTKLVWPYATNNIEAIERAEKAAASDADINFSNIPAVPSEHSIMVKLTNEAIDNTAFDIEGFVKAQITLAEQRYINKKMFAPALFTGLKGPFALASGTTSLTAVDGTWKAILNKIATIAGKGYDMSGFAFVMPARTKALLEATPKANGQGGFVCENDKIAGYPVFVSEYVGYYQTGSNTQAFNTDEYPMAYGCWNYLALCQHGTSRFVIDPTTLAEYNEVRFILHNNYSITDLSKRGDDTAFGICKLNDCTANGVKIDGDVTVQPKAGSKWPNS